VTEASDLGEAQAAPQQHAELSVPARSMSVWARIKEHKVAQWTLAYAAGAYTLLHSVEMVSDALDWPHLVVRILTLLLLFGLPLAATLAWFHGHRAQHRVSGAELAILAALLVLAAGVLFVLGRPAPEGASANIATSVPATSGVHPGVTAPLDASIAVLPFVNMSGDSRNEYLGDGLSEELSNRLAKIQALRVAARTSAFAFKGKDMDVNEIATKLGVRYLVEGSVKRQANRIRITAALVDGASRSKRWSNSYELPTTDFFSVESDIASQVITALELVLGERTRSSTARTTSGSGIAYDYFLQGLAYLRQPKTPKTLEAAEQLFERALAEQPDFARAQAGLCETHVERYRLERVPSYVTVAERACANAEALDGAAHEVHMAVGGLRLATGDAAGAEASYRHALALVPQSSDVLLGLAESLADGLKIEEAQAMYRRAIATQSSYPAAHLAYGNFLFSQGRAAEAVVPYERAAQLAPGDSTPLNNLGGAYLLMGNLEKADDAFQRSLAIEPRRSTYSNAALVHYYLGKYDKAADMLRKAIELTPADHRLWGNLADAQLFAKQPEQALQSYRRAIELVDGELAMNPKHPINQAQAAYYATRLGEKNRARQAIEIALSEGEENVYVQYYVALAKLGLGEKSTALAHAKRARELGYAESLMESAPELREIREML